MHAHDAFIRTRRKRLLIRSHSFTTARTSEVVIKISVRFYGVSQVFVFQRSMLGNGKGTSHANGVFDLESQVRITRRIIIYKGCLTCRPLKSLLARYLVALAVSVDSTLSMDAGCACLMNVLHIWR